MKKKEGRGGNGREERRLERGREGRTGDERGEQERRGGGEDRRKERKKASCWRPKVKHLL